MNFSLQKPPIYERLHARFGVNWDDGIAITYGDTVYSKNPLREDLIFHEEVHVWQQQQMGVEQWWDRYLNDKVFRLEQEVQAYRRQILALEGLVKDRNRLYILKRQIYIDLSSSMYDYLCSYDQAKVLLST